MLTRRALLSRTAHAFAGAALASMMRWWPKREEDVHDLPEDEGDGVSFVCTEIDLENREITFAPVTIVYLDSYGKACEETVELPSDLAKEAIAMYAQHDPR